MRNLLAYIAISQGLLYALKRSQKHWSNFKFIRLIVNHTLYFLISLSVYMVHFEFQPTILPLIALN